MPNIDEMFHDAEAAQVQAEAADLGKMFGAFYDACVASKMPEGSAQQLTAMYGVHIFNKKPDE